MDFAPIEFALVETASTGSTNADLADAARLGAPEGTVHVTDHQTGGRGRLDREWVAPQGSGLAASILLRPSSVPLHRWGWLPLLTGVAVADAVAALGVRAVRLKWPNDVEVDGRKLAGILVEAVSTPDGMAAVVGVGLNVAMTVEQLPVAHATSLAVEGIEVDRRDVLNGFLHSLNQHYSAWRAAEGSPEAGLASAYTNLSSSIGSTVRVSLPDGSVEEGLVSGVDAAGRLLLGSRAISSGDVVHVRRSGAAPQ